MLIRLICATFLLPLVACASVPPAVETNSVLRVVPESYVSKAWTVYMTGEEEMRVTFWRPDVFRIEKGLKVADTNLNISTSISATGQYITTTNESYTVSYKDPLNRPDGAQIVLPEVKEDASRVIFIDTEGEYTWQTTALKLVLDKREGKFNCSLVTGEKVWAESKPVVIVPAPTTNDVGFATQYFATSGKESYFGGGQQNGSFVHTGKAIDIVADCNWAEGGHPNPAPWMMARVDKGVYYGMLRNTFSSGRYDFTKGEGGEVSFCQRESRFDAFYFIGRSFNQVLDRYTEFTGRPNFIPIWGLELGDADAWMTRDQTTKEPKQNDKLEYVETTPDVIQRNAEKYRAADMPGGWLLVNDGYGCKYMQLSWVVEALKGLGFKTGLWTEGALDRLKWEIGTAGTRVQKIDVAWSGPAYQHGLDCNKAAFDGFIENSDARAFIWTCQGWAGTQRYGVCWTGDQYGNFDLIRYHVPTVTGSGMSGQAYATTDIDGIFGGSNESYLRDLQWKCFTPAMYVMNGWGDINKAPWSYPEPYKSIIRDWLKWKLRMTPYIYALCREAWDTGAPIVRPLAWNYPDDAICLNERVSYEMMLGRDILVAPVYESMEDCGGWYLRGIYIPDGNWYDFTDGRLVRGGKTIHAYPLTLSTIPAFVRGGAILPMYPEALYSSQVPKDTVTFNIFPDGMSEFEMYEDDGETRAYEKGEWTRQRIKVAAPAANETGDIKVDICGVTGKGFKGQVFRRAYELWIHTGAKPAQVLLGGDEVLPITAEGDDARAIYANSPQCWYYDPEDMGGTVRVKLHKRCTKESVEVIVNVPAGKKTDAYKPYPAAPKEVLEKAKDKAKTQTKLVAKMNAADLGQGLGENYTIEVDGTWKRVSGSVVCAKDTDEKARVTFRITTDTGKVIFERVGQKGKDAPQICEVNIPADAKTLTFSFVQEGDVNARGVWKNLKLVK